MKKSSGTDYLAYILLKLIGPIIRRLPLNFSLFLAKKLGELFYHFDVKHKALAYANIKTALGGNLSSAQLSKITKEFYRTFAQNLMEVFLLSLITKEYIEKYISIEGMQNIEEGFKRGKGVILLATHEGSWEFSNIVCAILGFPFSLFIRNQGFPRLNSLLNRYRLQKGCRIISRQEGIRDLIRALKNNEAIGMTCDQGGRSGTLVKFFGKNASMASGAIRLALKYDAALIPVFYSRIKGPYLKIFVAPIFKIKKSENLETDIKENLQEVVQIFEKYISRYPKEYLWTYKSWKYSDKKNILLLSDGKTGHLRQAEAAAFVLGNLLKNKGYSAKIETVDVKFKNKFSRPFLMLSSCLAGKYHCQGCLWCLRNFLEQDTYKKLVSQKADFVISCGSSLAPINFVLSRENLAKSIVIMRPSILSFKRFDLAIMPQHDNPPARRNVIITDGALNLIDNEYLNNCKLQIANHISQENNKPLAMSIGLLIGGNTKDFHLEKGTMRDVIKQLKSVSESNNADILVSTSRRTPLEIEGLIKDEFKDYPRCKLLVIANEQNFPFTIGAILGLSKIVIVSAESISMVSEAASSGKYIIVFKARINHRHNIFLTRLANQGYIYLCEPSGISAVINELERQKPKINILNDRAKVAEGLKRII